MRSPLTECLSDERSIAWLDIATVCKPHQNHTPQPRLHYAVARYRQAGTACIAIGAVEKAQ
jgi:hypothetical protein